MGVVWTLQEAHWVLRCDRESAKVQPAFHWQDNYVSFEAAGIGDLLTYKVTLRRPKEHDLITDEKWLMLAVGRQKKQREHLEGIKVYRDVKVIFAKLGAIPSLYFLMTRERHGQVG